jgi:alcohol dehydrogenase (cytochrome c)
MSKMIVQTTILAVTLAGNYLANAADTPALSFTTEQVSLGREEYRTSCANCHGPTLGGGPVAPPLDSASFRMRWRLKTAGELTTYMRTKMPPDNPGGLPETTYINMLAYILNGNGTKPGTKPLPADLAQLPAASLGSMWRLSAVPSSHEAEGVAAWRPDHIDAISQQVQKQRKERMLALTPVTEAMLKDPPPGSWLAFRGAFDAHGFSPLSQIKRDNVAKLQVAWSWALAAGHNQIEPLVHEGIMFVASNGTVQALDAATGDLMWQYSGQGSSGDVRRNIAISGDRIFLPDGGRIIALDMHTGTLVWEHNVIAPEDQVRFGAGPLAAKGKIIVPVTGCSAPYPGGCYVVAFDAGTGEEAWRFNVIARPGQPGGNSWNGLPVDHRFGGSVWVTPTYDPDLDLIYFGTAQTYAVGGLLTGASGKPGASDALYTDSTIALRPETGQLAWYYQHLKRDVWDLDWVFERILATLKIDGKPRRVVIGSGKLGIFDVLDATSGAYLLSYDVGMQNLVSAIDPKSGDKTIAPGFEPKPNVKQYLCPSSMGFRNWLSGAFDAGAGVVYIPLADSCMQYEWTPNEEVGARDIQISPSIRQDSDGNFGRVQAFNLLQKKRLWEVRRRPFPSSAILATAGGLLFEGSRDRFFRASDNRTGEVLWKMRLDGAPSAFPITYSVNGIQYVAVTTGGGNPFDAVLGSMTPEIATGKGGTTLWVFRLPP